jgi:preprotein translocase subunit YajC
MLLALQLLAQTTTDQPGGQPGGSVLIQLVMFGMIGILFYFLMIRAPMKRQEQERQGLISNLKKNDEVVTTGGIIGVVANVSDTQDEVTLKLDESSNVRVRVMKSNIHRNLSREKQLKEQKEAKA